MDQRLLEWADRLDHDGWAACLLDSEQTLVWVSRELQRFLDETDEDRLGYGQHIAMALVGDTWSRPITPESQQQLLRQLAPYLDEHLPVDSLSASQKTAREPAARAHPRPPVLMAGDFRYCDRGRPSYLVRYIIVVLRDEDGTRLGTLVTTDMAAPATLVALLAQGDRAMHERMAELVEPARHPAAVVFADLPSSGELSRRLPSAVYFRLIQRLTATFDELVCDYGGMVGKHVGDGMTAFFLAEHANGDSAAATAALRAVLGLQSSSPAVFAECIGDELRDDPLSRFDVGLHWGANLYMGQLVPGSRLEVTALGDEVNECARIQEAAEAGSILASKPFIELIGPDELEECSIDPTKLVYEPLADLPGASEKGVRDAGTLPVTRVHTA